MKGTIKRVTMVAVLSVAGCSSDSDSGMGPELSEAVASIEITPGTTTLASLGETIQLSATARGVSGRTIAGKSYTWASSSPDVATVSSSGLVMAIVDGTTTITATVDGVQGSATITVAQGVVSIDVTPVSSTLISIEESLQLTAEGTDALGNPVPGVSFAWRSSAESVVTVSPAGLATAISNGVATITAILGGVEGTAGVTVAQEVSSVEITPTSFTLASLGEIRRLGAGTRDANGHPVAGAPISWATSDESIATVTQSGEVAAVAKPQSL